MANFFTLTVILLSVFLGCESAKILGVFPLPLKSHHIVFRPLMSELIKRGHEVTVITTDPAFPKGQAPANLTEIDVHDLSYDYWNKFIGAIASEKNSVAYFKLVSELFLNLVVAQMKSTVIQNFLNENKTFDVLFTESCVRPALVYSSIFNVPTIEISTLSGVMSAFEAMGAATHPIIYPNPLHKRVYNLTLWEKFIELYTHYSIELMLEQQIQIENEVFRKVIGSESFDLEDIRRNVQMLFINVHPIWDFNRPVPPNVMYVGGLHRKPHNELPKDLKSYLDSSKNGVIYISFGTNVKPSMLPQDKIKVFTDVFSQLPYDIVWKWDTDILPRRPKNVLTSKWLPQSDLLRHSKIKLFITQGGLQSTDEAIVAGVPLIGVPIFSDQYFNVEQYLRFNIGVLLVIETLTQEQLKDAIENVINDKSYRRNIVELGKIMNDQPQSPVERAVWWTEHVLRHGRGTHLRSPASHLRWTEYYELDLVLILLFIILLLLAAIIVAIQYIISYLKTNKILKVKIQ